MICIKQTTDFVIEENCAVTIGKFDGLHKGHRILVQSVLQTAKEKNLKTVVFSFATSPRIVLSKESAQLMTTREKEKALEQLGVDYLIEYPFTDEVRTMSPMDFVNQILVQQLHMKYLAVGADFHFGYKRQGDCQLLRLLSEKMQFQLAIYPKLKYNKKDISSSYIREEIRFGNMKQAKDMLGGPYRFEGVVEHGKALGRTIGFPTLNIVPEAGKVLPPNGVYFTKVLIDEKQYIGVANIGMQPTVDGNKLLLEVYVLEFSQMIYGKWVSVDLFHFHRPEQKFEGIDALMKKLREDTGECIRYFEKKRD